MLKSCLVAVALLLMSSASNYIGFSYAGDPQTQRIPSDEFRANGGEMSILVRVEPNYPFDALERGLSGSAKLFFSVGTNGRPFEIRISESNPRKSFGEAGREALEKWLYTPPRLDGKPVIVTGEYVELTFDLHPG